MRVEGEDARKRALQHSSMMMTNQSGPAIHYRLIEIEKQFEETTVKGLA